MLWLWGRGDFYQARLFPAFIDMVGFALIRYLWWFYILPKHLTADVRSLLLLENENPLSALQNHYNTRFEQSEPYVIASKILTGKEILLQMFERYLETLSQLWQYIQVLRTTGSVKNRQAQFFFYFVLLSCIYIQRSKYDGPKKPMSRYITTSLLMPLFVGPIGYRPIFFFLLLLLLLLQSLSSSSSFPHFYLLQTSQPIHFLKAYENSYN